MSPVNELLLCDPRVFFSLKHDSTSYLMSLDFNWGRNLNFTHPCEKQNTEKQQNKIPVDSKKYWCYIDDLVGENLRGCLLEYNHGRWNIQIRIEKCDVL